MAEAVAAGRSSLGVMPTGSGKLLVIAALMAGLAEAGKRCLMLTHVRELIEQIARGVDYGVFCPGLGRPRRGVPLIGMTATPYRLRGCFFAECAAAASTGVSLTRTLTKGKDGACES